MDILVIGGTRFLGRAIVEAALNAGHHVTMFNRGRSNADLFPQVEKLQGDRMNADDLAQFNGRTWDAVVDTCGYVPRAVRLTAEALRDSVKQYVFISTISVYGPPLSETLDETGRVQPMPENVAPDTEEVTGETYGPLKVLCEQTAESIFPGRTLHVRSGLIVGPHDPTDRFTYWPVRIARGGDVLCPPGNSPIQIIDARDQAAWIIRMIEAGKSGVYNVTGPAQPLTFGEVTRTCNVVGGSAANLIEADADFLLEKEVGPWVDLPLWLPESDADMSRIQIGKALADGLTFRPLEDTVRDTLAWFDSERGRDGELKYGIKPDREAEVLAAWRERA
ncbi:MAG: NAD-dependent epimerase/dehydratase family protein [bacterium]|nr:NAD-dependent epimerase/dehydratase family protein [bacterium]